MYTLEILLLNKLRRMYVLSKIVKKTALKKYYKILERVERHASIYAEMSDNQLKDQTIKLKKRIAHGETLNDILPEAFATIREADKRVLGLYPFPEQIIGGIILHSGNVSEMKTGIGTAIRG